MIPYPQISPYFLRLGGIEFRWYGLMYLLSFIFAFFFLRWYSQKEKIKYTPDELMDLLFYVFIGMLLGARVFHFVIYSWSTLVQDPWAFFKIWQGGMSFHGALIGIVVAVLLFARHRRTDPWVIGDLLVLPGSLMLALGRIGNFINGELFGRQTDVPWCMVFPQGGPVCRHPSQLYEMLGEGVLLFILLWLVRKSSARHSGVVFALFLIWYGMIRFVIEFWREPEMPSGLVAGMLTIGQILCLVMILAGIITYYFRRRHEATK